MTVKTSRLQLGEIEAGLTPKEREVLQTLRQFRMVKSDQVQRMLFTTGHSTLKAAQTKTYKVLRHLERLDLIGYFKQQYSRGCYGPEPRVWHLTESGYRLLDLGIDDDSKRLKAIEPQYAFVRHTVAVTECYLQIVENCKTEPKMSVRHLDLEPDCWRSYQKDGKTISLRPDLYAETMCGEYRDRWFIEVDLDTESLSVVIEKCRRYQQYYLTNKEQTATGKFPVVMWIVPSERRKENITRAIKEYFGDRYVHMFLVITPNHLKTFLVNGARKEDLC